MSIWRMFVVSLFSPKKIADLLGEKKRKVLAYLSFLILVCLIPTFIMTSVIISTSVNNFQTFMKSDEVPDFQLTNGVLTSDRDEPIIGELDGGKYIFDTSGTYDEEKVRAEKADIAILSDRIILENGAREQQIKYAELGGLEFSKTQLNDMIDVLANLKWLAIVAAIFLIYLFQYFKLIMITILLALIGLLLNLSLQNRVPYGRLWVVSAFSLTIPTAISWIVYSLGVNVPFSGWIYLAACATILFFVLREISYRPKNVAPDSNELTR